MRRAKTKAATAETPVAGTTPTAPALEEEDTEDGLALALLEAEAETASALEDSAWEEEVAALDLVVMVADFLAEPDWAVEEAMTSS